jgi:hypothetical protein
MPITIPKSWCGVLGGDKSNMLNTNGPHRSSTYTSFFEKKPTKLKKELREEIKELTLQRNKLLYIAKRFHDLSEDHYEGDDCPNDEIIKSIEAYIKDQEHREVL